MQTSVLIGQGVLVDRPGIGKSHVRMESKILLNTAIRVMFTHYDLDVENWSIDVRFDNRFLSNFVQEPNIQKLRIFCSQCPTTIQFIALEIIFAG